MNPFYGNCNKIFKGIIYINLVKINEVVEAYTPIVTEMEKYCEDLIDIKNNLDGASYAEVRSALSKIEEECKTQCKDLKQMQECLRKARWLYQKAESTIVGYSNGKSNGANARGDNKKEDGELGIMESTKALIILLEGEPFLTPRINNNGSFTIGYGFDFTEEEDPEMFNKYFRRDEEGIIVVKTNMSQKDAEETIKKAADAKGITKGLNDFINGKGYGNIEKPLIINQNQYDALFSYFYSNGQEVFTNKKYNEWKEEGGEYEKRAEARKELVDYLISNNGNYDSEKLEELFVNSKGGNIEYEYKDRRKSEANLFIQ